MTRDTVPIAPGILRALAGAASAYASGLRDDAREFRRIGLTSQASRDERRAKLHSDAIKRARRALRNA